MHKILIVLFSISLLCGSVAALDVETTLCTGVEDRMPVGEADTFMPNVERVYLWTKVTGVEGETAIRHVWLHEGREMADVELPVKGDPWRTYSYKTILPEWTGSWEVKIVGLDGNVITSVAFTIGKKMKEKPAEAPKSDMQVSPAKQQADSADKK